MLLKDCGYKLQSTYFSLQCYIFPFPYIFGNEIWAIYYVLNLGRPKIFAYKYVWSAKHAKLTQNNKSTVGPKQSSSILKWK